MLSQVLPELTLSLFGLTFVEGLLAFLSPCILPLLPIYLMYLSQTCVQVDDLIKTLLDSCGSL